MEERKNAPKFTNYIKYRFEMSSWSRVMKYGKHEWGFTVMPFKGEPPLK